jgi:hypothetical protein
MGAVGFGAVLLAVFLIIVAGFVWQGALRSVVIDPAEYLVSEAAEFVYDRLSDRALEGLDPEVVRRILDWNLHFTQVVGPRQLGRVPIIGSGEGMEYVMDRARAAGIVVEPLDIAEVMAIETDYLLSIGAVGGPVETDQMEEESP